MTLSPTTIESAYIGLVVAVTSVLSVTLAQHTPSFIRFLRYGFDLPHDERRKAASAMFFIGLIPWGFLSLWIRSSMGTIPVEARWLVGFFSWTCFLFGAALWQASVLALGRGTQYGRWYMRGMIAAAMVSMVVFGWSDAFHPPIRTAPPPEARHER